MSNNNKREFPGRTGASGGTEGCPASGFDNALQKKIEEVGPGSEALEKHGAVTPTELKQQGPDTTIEDAPLSKPKTKLQLLVEEMVKDEKRANVDLDATDPRTRPGREVAKREAKERFAEERSQYWRTLQKGLCAVFLTGTRENQLQFVDQLPDDAPAGYLVVEADLVYREIARDVDASMRTDRMFEPAQFARMVSGIMTLCRDLGLSEAPNPHYADGFMLKTHEDVVRHVRKLVRDCCGDQLNTHYLAKVLTDRAWEIRYSDDVVPVIVLGADSSEIEGLSEFFNHRTVKFEVTSNQQNAVAKAFNVLKSKLRKS